MKYKLNKLYNMDCMQAMKDIPDDYFELAIVDPPYGIGMDGGNVGYKGKNNFTKKKWDSKTPNKKYFEQLQRVSKNQIIWGGNYFSDKLKPNKCFIIWDKGEGFYNRTYAECEMAWASFSKNAKIYKRDPLANRDYVGKIHPTQKPIELYKWLLINYAEKGDKILDTHVGSASSLIACYDLGYDYIGFELDEEYYNKAMKRLEKHQAQLSMFRDL